MTTKSKGESEGITKLQLNYATPALKEKIGFGNGTRLGDRTGPTDLAWL